jgi:2-keto-3-deoxy-L-rhamnonate aldolase RhmA
MMQGDTMRSTRTWVFRFSIAGLVALSLAPTVETQPKARHNKIIDLLASGNVVFGWFASVPRTAGAEQRAEQRMLPAAARAAKDPLMDFVFLNMEAITSYNPAMVKAFLQTMADGGISRNPNDHPLMTRLPIFRNDPVAARQRVAEMLNLGVHAIVFPDMESGEEAQQALASMRYAQPASSKFPQPAGVRPDEAGQAPAHWDLSADEYKRKADVYPINPQGELASIFIIESVKGIENSREITRTRPTVAFPGPGTLGRVFQGDAAKVEAAIQTQLASCKEFDVPCGITANPADVAKRIKEGFRMIIIYDRDYPETIKVGREAAGRG